MKKYLLLALLAATATAQELTVSADGIASRPADQLSLAIGTVTKAKDVESALKGNSEKMQKVLAALKKAGLTKEEISTGSFEIRPISSLPPKDHEQDWHPSIIAYEVTNTLEIQTDKITEIGKIIETATKSGANEIQNIRFSLKDPGQLQTEAIDLATKNAIRNAEQLAHSAHLTLKSIKRISIDDASFEAPKSSGLYLRSMSTAPPIEAGEITRSAKVTILYDTEALAR